jgi:hypothetical protein
LLRREGGIKYEVGGRKYDFEIWGFLDIGIVINNN